MGMYDYEIATTLKDMKDILSRIEKNLESASNHLKKAVAHLESARDVPGVHYIPVGTPAMENPSNCPVCHANPMNSQICLSSGCPYGAQVIVKL